MEQPQDRISDERLAEIVDAGTNCFKICVPTEGEKLARELQQARRELAKYKKALHDHLCEYDAADWLGCAGHPDGDNCVLCDADRGLIPKSGCFHENLVNQTRELAALRANHAGLKHAVEYTLRCLEETGWDQEIHSSVPGTLRGALAEARKLEGK